MQHCREVSCTLPALVSVPHPLQTHNLFHINTEQTVRRTATEHTSSQAKTTDALAEKGRMGTEGQLHPPQQSILPWFTHIISPVSNMKVLTSPFCLEVKGRS